MKSIIDALFRTEGLSYRRLLAFVVSTVLLVHGYITGEQWVTVVIVFISGEALPRMVQAYRMPATAAPAPTPADRGLQSPTGVGYAAPEESGTV